MPLYTTQGIFVYRGILVYNLHIVQCTARAAREGRVTCIAQYMTYSNMAMVIIIMITMMKMIVTNIGKDHKTENKSSLIFGQQTVKIDNILP